MQKTKLKELEAMKVKQQTVLQENRASVDKAQKTLEELCDKNGGSSLVELKKAETDQTAKEILEAIIDKVRTKCAPFNAAYEIHESETDPEQKSLFMTLELRKYYDVIEAQMHSYLQTQGDDDDDMISLEDDDEITAIAEWIAESLSYVGQQSNDRGVNIDDKYRSDIKNVMKHVMSVGMCHWYYASNIMYYDARKREMAEAVAG